MEIRLKHNKIGLSEEKNSNAVGWGRVAKDKMLFY